MLQKQKVWTTMRLKKPDQAFSEENHIYIYCFFWLLSGQTPGRAWTGPRLQRGSHLCHLCHHFRCFQGAIYKSSVFCFVFFLLARKRSYMEVYYVESDWWADKGSVYIDLGWAFSNKNSEQQHGCCQKNALYFLLEAKHGCGLFGMGLFCGRNLCDSEVTCMEWSLA